MTLIIDTKVAFGCLATAIFSLLIGYALGARRSRNSRRQLQRSLSGRSIELLESRSEVVRLEARLAEQPRHENVIRLALSRLTAARRIARQRFVSESAARLACAEAEARARRAARLARLAAARVRILESEAGATGTITTCAPKSYGNGQSVTVSVVDHETQEARHDAAGRVPHQDRVRLASLLSSNEARCTRSDDHAATPAAEPVGAPSGLRLIDGLVADDENRLNAVGIHDLAQLAELTEPEQLALRHLIDNPSGPRPLGAWIGTARALLGSQSPA